MIFLLGYFFLFSINANKKKQKKHSGTQYEPDIFLSLYIILFIPMRIVIIIPILWRGNLSCKILAVLTPKWDTQEVVCLECGAQIAVNSMHICFEYSTFSKLMKCFTGRLNLLSLIVSSSKMWVMPLLYFIQCNMLPH